ncbi:MAG: hypothetical protein AB8F34_04085 [Akkermansiaceae bacterium]
MQKIICLLLTGLLITQFSVADEASDARKTVEFFEKLYKTKIKNVAPLKTYDDPDKFYSAIAKQLGIPKKALDAVEKKYGWKQNDKYFLTTIVKGGWDADNWGVMVTKFPAAMKNAKTKEEKMKLLKEMEMKMVVIGYNEEIHFPGEEKAKPPKKKDK